jgi:hypothetical protein
MFKGILSVLSALCGSNKTKILQAEDSLVSAEGIEYHPPCGDTQQKRPSLIESLPVSAEGIEPSTNGLKGRCSAIELRAHRYG